MLPTNIFFTRNDTVVLHGFHLHPVAIYKHKHLPFQSTIDGDLLDFFDRDAIHVVTEPDDLSMLEVTDPSRRFPIRATTTTAHHVAGAMISRASPLHRWLFEHRIIIRGSDREYWEKDIVQDILSKMGQYKQMQRRR